MMADENKIFGRIHRRGVGRRPVVTGSIRSGVPHGTQPDWLEYHILGRIESDFELNTVARGNYFHISTYYDKRDDPTASINGVGLLCNGKFMGGQSGFGPGWSLRTNRLKVEKGSALKFTLDRELSENMANRVIIVLQHLDITQEALDSNMYAANSYARILNATPGSSLNESSPPINMRAWRIETNQALYPFYFGYYMSASRDSISSEEVFLDRIQVGEETYIIAAHETDYPQEGGSYCQIKTNPASEVNPFLGYCGFTFAQTDDIVS